MGERLRTVVERLELGPEDRVLEMERRFDRIFAVRVGLFHREPERARRLAGRWLAPGGWILAESDAPGGAVVSWSTRSGSVVALREHR